MGTAAKLAIPLYVGDPADHAGCTFVVGMDADELLDGVPSTPARINSLDPLSTYFGERFMLPGSEGAEPLPAGFVGLAKVNLTQDDGTGVGARVRIALDAAGYLAAPTRMLPTAISGNTFDSGTYTDVDDDPFTPGVDYMQVNAFPGTGEALFTFAAAHANFLPGADGILVLASVATDQAFNSITFELYEGGAQKATATTIEEPRRGRGELAAADPSRLFAAYFDSASLSAATATPQVKVTMEGSQAKLMALALYPTVVNTMDYDSGWFVALPDVTDTAFGDLPASYGGDLPSRNVFHWPASIVDDVLYWCFQIRDPFNVDGYIDSGEMLAGARFEATINRDLGKLVDLKPLGTKTITAGGKHVGVAGKFLRSIHMPLSWMTPAEGAALLERIQRMNTLAPVAISLHSGSASEARLLSCYGSLGVAPEYAAPYALHRGTTIVVDEEL